MKPVHLKFNHPDELGNLHRVESLVCPPEPSVGMNRWYINSLDYDGLDDVPLYEIEAAVWHQFDIEMERRAEAEMAAAEFRAEMSHD